MTPRQSGFTLIELIAALAIIVIVFGFAVPSIDRMIERNKAAMGINWIIRAINMTRLTAIERGVLTTLCPTRDRISCGGAWHDQVMIFTDSDNSRSINNSDVLVLSLDFPYKGSTLRWRSFRNRQYLQMTPSGFTHYQNGNFVYCARNRDLQFARQIVLNMQGRVRRSYDRDNDGLVEDRSGKHLRC